MKIVAIVAGLVVLIVAAAYLARSRATVTPASQNAPQNGGRRRIRDLTLDDIRSGRNWKVADPDELSQIGARFRLEDVHILEADSFAQNDTIAYAALFVTEDGSVSPLVLIKMVGDIDYGGEYCEVQDGKWRQVGLVSNPSAPHGVEYVANPLDIDPSFTTLDAPKADFRAEHRANFRKWCSSLNSTHS